MNKFRFQGLMSAAAAVSSNIKSMKLAQSMIKWGAPGKQNRRGTPIVPGRLTANGKGYAILDNGALVVAVEPDQTREVKSRPKKSRRYQPQWYAEDRRLLNEACRQHRLTKRLQRRHALKHA